MGRRSLRNIDPGVDLSLFLKTPDELPQPWDEQQLFGRVAPLEIEVGSGKGLFLVAAALAQPERNFLGIELARKYARLVASRLARHALTHARIVHGDARRVLASLVPDHAADVVHVYFPDPWWKKRHQKRRVMTAPFLRDLDRVLVPGGQLHFWTDVHEYFEATLSLIAATVGWEGPWDEPLRTPTHELDYRTHFERRMRLGGHEVYRARFAKPRPSPGAAD
jgi:tRNA (guanine-N7-)-methyltransferase